MIQDEVKLQANTHNEKYVKLLNKKQLDLELEIDKNKKLRVKNKNIKKLQTLGFKKKALAFKKENASLKKQIDKAEVIARDTIKAKNRLLNRFFKLNDDYDKLNFLEEKKFIDEAKIEIEDKQKYIDNQLELIKTQKEIMEKDMEKHDIEMAALNKIMGQLKFSVGIQN